MPHWFFRQFSFIRQKQAGFNKALTLIELLLTVAILGTLSAIAVPMYTNYMDKQRNILAIVDIKNIESQIERFMALSGGRPPNDFAEANIPAKNDPWGRPYQYLRIQGVDWNGIKHLVRYDKHDKPLNHDYDLLSIGKDGVSETKLWKQDAFDDIIRCNGGTYVGPASEY